MKKKLFFKFYVLAVIAAFATFSSCNDYDDDISNLEGQITALKSELPSQISTVKAEVGSAMDTKVAALNGEISSLKTKLTGLESQLSTKVTQEELDALNKKIDAVKTEILEKAVMLEVFNGFKTKTEKDLAELKEGLEDLETRLATAEIELGKKASQEDLTKLQNELTAYKLTVNGKLQELQNSLNALGIRVKTLEETTIPALKQELLNALGKAVLELEGKITTLKNDLTPRIDLLEAILKVKDGESEVIADIYKKLGDQLKLIEDNASDIYDLQVDLDKKYNALVAVDIDLQKQITENLRLIGVNSGLIAGNTTNIGLNKDAIDKINLYINNTLEPRLNGIEGDIKTLQDRVNGLDNDVKRLMGMFSKRLTSITLVPSFHVDGIAAIKFESLVFKPQVYMHEHNLYGRVTEPIDKDWVNEPIAIDNRNTIVEFRLSPRYLTQKSIDFPFFESIISENIKTYAVDPDFAFKNSPIAPVPGQTLEITPEGILRLKVTKTIDGFLNNDWGRPVSLVYQNGYGDKFYFASLGIPIAKEYLTEKEKEEGGAVITSEHYRLYEELDFPRIKSTIAEEEIVAYYEYNGTRRSGYNHYYPFPYALDRFENPVHYSSANLLYESNVDELIDKEVYWNEGIDLHTLVTVCTENDHSTLKDWADFGLEFRFELAHAPYLQGDNLTDQQQFAEIDSKGFMTSRVYTIDGETKTAKGREPIVQVSLINNRKNDALVDMRFIKIKWIEKPAEPQVLSPYTFDAQQISCDTITNRFGTQEMNELIYRKIEKWGIPKETFHEQYLDLEIMHLMKGSNYIIKDSEFTVTGLTESVVKESPADIMFYQIPDANDNTSFNLVWNMTPAAVGKIVPKDRETYTITVKFIDKTNSKVKGDIYMDFIMDVTIPTQEFAYQGTYWKNGVGEGVFNVNPIVYNSTTHDNPPLAGESHIDADLVDGFIFKGTKLKPANLAQFINHLEGCAEVKFVFDQSRFGSFAHLRGFTVGDDGVSLWNSNTPGTLVPNFDYPQVNAVAASINNTFGALANRNPSLYANRKNPLLGTEQDEASAVIRLHETDMENGTPAAKKLIGKNVPVNLVVAYNAYNKVAVQKFEVHFIDPLKIDGAISDMFTDAVIDGSFVNVATGFTFTDWNFYTVAKNAITNPTEKQKWASQLYLYYAVNNVVFDTQNVKTSLKLVNNTYIHVDGTKDGNLPTKRSLKQVDDNGVEVTSDPTQLGYYNNDGVPVNVDYKMFIDVSVNYKWGTLAKPGLSIHVNKAAGTPSN